MDVGPELITNDDEVASHRKRRSKINSAAEAPPSKRIKSATEATRPRVPRALTTRTRAVKLGDSKWFTVVSSIAHEVPSDLVLVDTRPRLWSTNRAELGSAFMEISDSKCVNGISWTLTDMPIIVLDNESMVLEKPKDVGAELSMDLVLIREFHHANLNTPQKDEDNIVYNLNLSHSKDNSRPVHSLVAAPSINGESQGGPPMRKFPLPVPIAEHTTGVYLDLTPPLLTETPVSQSKRGRKSQRAPQKAADKPLLKPVQDVSKSEELKSSNNDSVPESATDHGSAILPDTSSSNTTDTPQRKRGRPLKAQGKPSDESVLDPEKAVPRFKEQEKPVDGSPPQIPGPSKPTEIFTAKAKQGKKQQGASQKSSSKAFLDTPSDVPRSKKRENANGSLPVPAQTPDPSFSTTTSMPKPKQGGQQEMLRQVPGVSRLKEQKQPNNETQPMARLTSDHTESISTATSNLEARKPIRNKTLGYSTDQPLPEQSDTLSLTSRSNTGLRSKGVKGKLRRDSEKPAHAPLRSGPLPESERERVQRIQKVTKGSSKRARSPGLSISTPAYKQQSVSGLQERGPPVRKHQSRRVSQLSQKKEPAKPIKNSLPSTIRTASELLGDGRKSVYASLRFTKKKNTAIDTPIPGVSDNVAGALQQSVPAPSPASVPAPALPQCASTIEYARGPPNMHLHRDSYSQKGVFPRRTPDIPMSDLENIMRTQNDIDPLFRHYPDNRTLPHLNKSMQGFAERRDDTSGVMFQPPEPVKEVMQHFLAESVTLQIKMPSHHSVPTTSNLQPERERRKEPQIHSRPPILSTDVAPHSLHFNKYKDAPQGVRIPGMFETSLNILPSFPGERDVHLNGYSLRHYTPDRSMSDLENIIRGQEGHFEPVFGHYPDNRLLPNFNRLPLAFTGRYDTPFGGQVAPRDIVNIESRTRNQMDVGRDGFRAGRDTAHVGWAERRHGWTDRWEPPHREQASMRGWAERRAHGRETYVDTSDATQARFRTEMRRAENGFRDRPWAQNARRAPRRAGHLVWQEPPRAHTHSPVPTSPWITTDFDKRPRSAPYLKPPPLGPRLRHNLQEPNSMTTVTGASDNQVAALSSLRNLSPNLQNIRSEPAITIAQTQSSLTRATSFIKDVTMVSLPDKLIPPAPSIQPLQSVAPDGTSLTDREYTSTQTLLSPKTSSANDITMGYSTDEPQLPASSALVPIEQMPVPTVPTHASKTSATMDISIGSRTDKSAPSTSPTEPLPLSAATPTPSLKRKGKEKALASESPDDESFAMQDEVRQAKKAKLCHDPVIDVSRIFEDSTMPMACSSKTKLEDLPGPQSSCFPQTPDQTNAMVVESQLSSQSISSSPMKPAKRRGRPPKSAKVASNSSASVTTIKPAPARHKLEEHQPPSVCRSAPNLTCSSQAPPQISVMASEVQLSSSVSVDTKSSAKRRGRQATKVAASTSAPALSVTSGSTLDELPSISCSLPKSPKKAQAQSSSTPAVPVQWREDGVPLPIPAEIQALVDAYINGVPIGVFASSGHIQGFWGLKLTKGEEIGYAFMGFYRVCRVLESLDEGELCDEENEKDMKGKGKAVVAGEVSKTRVRWRFKLKWEPGGEGWQIRDPQRLTSPWWNSNLKAQELAVVPRNNSSDSDDESTETYRLARRGSQNFSRRHCYFDQTFCSVLPLHLLAPINAEIPDAVLPRGWHCPDCGKLNFRYYLRHRRCDSSYCQDKPMTQGYMVEVDRLRDPQDGTPLSLPLNNVPEHIRAKSRIQVWNDRMKTLIYYFETRIIGGIARVQHIFTCNLQDLQRVPSELFNAIQMDVPLRRPTGDPHAYPYFVHFVDEVHGKGEDSSSWMTAPQCLHRAKEVMNSRGRKYGKKTEAELDINKLIIRAWVTSGSKRGSDLLQAKERCVVVMCLGCEVILSISPKSAMSPNDNQTRLPNLDKLITMDGLDPQEDQLTKPEPGESVKLDLGEKESQLHLVSTPSTMKEVMAKNQKGEKVEMTLSLVHGDVVLLEGDDFEYSIKRTGTSILLFGLSTSSKRPRQVLGGRGG